jgi:hypothetical protein
MRLAGQSGADLGDSGIEGDEPPRLRDAAERVENSRRSQLDRRARSGWNFARNSDAKAAAFRRVVLLLVVGCAVMMGVFIAMLVNAMMIVRGRVFLLNEGSLPRPAEDEGKREQRDENRML